MSFIQLGSDQIISSTPVPTNGQVPVWNPTTGQYEAGTVSGGGSGWSLTGNSDTIAGVNFIGTTDNQDLSFQVNNVQTLRLDSNAVRPFVDNLIFTGNTGTTKTILPTNLIGVTGYTMEVRGGSTSGAANLSPGGLNLVAGNGTGTLGANNGVNILTATPGASGTTLNSATTMASFSTDTTYTGGQLVFSRPGLPSAMIGFGNLDILSSTGQLRVSTQSTTAATVIGSLGGPVQIKPAAVATSASNTTVSAGDVTGSNAQGGTLFLSTGASTGNNASTSINFLTPSIGSSGSTANSPVNRMVLGVSATFPGFVLNFPAASAGVIQSSNNLTIQPAGTLTCQPSSNGSATFSANGTGATSVGTTGTGNVTIGKTTSTTTLAGFNKQTNMGYLEVFATAGQTLTTGSTTTLIWGTANVSNNMSYNTSTGVVTFPRVGRYLVSLAVAFSGNRTVDSNFGQMYTRVAGTVPRALNAMRTIAVHSVQGSFTQQNTMVLDNSFTVNVTAANQTMSITVFNEGWTNASTIVSSDLVPCFMTVIELH